MDQVAADKAAPWEDKARTINRGWANLKPMKPGEPSRNPSGRSKKIPGLAELAQKHAKAAVETLATCMNDNTASWSARVAAASELLDRGFGRAPQSMDMKVTATVSEEFEAFLRRINRRESERVIDGRVADDGNTLEAVAEFVCDGGAASDA